MDAQPFTEQSRAIRRVQGKEEDPVWSGNALLPPEEVSPGDEGQEEEGRRSCPAWVAAMSWRAGSEDSEAKEMLSLLEEEGSPPSLLDGLLVQGGQEPPCPRLQVESLTSLHSE